MGKYQCELLSPAGSPEIAKAVMEAGADAVYMGGNRFGARAYAVNFSEDEVLRTIELAHLSGKKLYLTVNTLLKERELEEELYPYLKPYYEAGLDAVIVQDLGVIGVIHDFFPELPIHASTQMSVSSSFGTRALQELGVSRVVTARELSLNELSTIHKETGMELETFVHGALCYSYSGQCLLSSMIGGRSGNRGRCAQPCRLPYQVLNTKGTGKEASGCLLSLKDLNTIDILPEILEHGVYSLKIEGRMKQLSYAAGVTAIYRKYLDLLETEGKEKYKVSQADQQRLMDLGNRQGFSQGYYKQHNGKSMVTFSNAAHNRLVTETNKELAGEKLNVPISGILTLEVGKPALLKLKNQEISVSVTGDQVQEARKAPLSMDEMKEKIQRTGDEIFNLEDLTIQCHKQVFLPVSKLNALRREGITLLKNACLEKYRREALPQKRMEENDFRKRNEDSFNKDTRISVSVRSREQMKAVQENEFVRRIYLPISEGLKESGREWLKKAIRQCHENKQECFGCLPFILRQEDIKKLDDKWDELVILGFDGFKAESLDGLAYLREKKQLKAASFSIVSGSHLYTWNNRSLNMLRRFGSEEQTLPQELNRKELGELCLQGTELDCYGNQVVMISAGCIHKSKGNCEHKEEMLYLSDRKNFQFPVWNDCTWCYNVIYNAKPLSLFSKKEELMKWGLAHMCLNFTKETEEETREVLKEFQKDKPDHPKEFTYGHFQRGVE